MRLSEEEYNALIHRKAVQSYSAPKVVKESKYGNEKVMADGILFDSKKEMARCLDLKILERAGKILNLVIQPSFELAPAVTIQGKLKKALVYRADFQYIENGVCITEDCKGFLTDVYKIKRHLMKSVHGIDIFET